MTTSNDRSPAAAVPFAKCSVEAPRQQHFCQIHHEEATLVDAIGRFAGAGIHAGEVVALVAPEKRLRKVFDSLRAQGVDIEEAIGTGSLVLSRPEEIREACFPGGVLDREAFKRAFRSTFDLGGPQGRVRLYGELSNAFWHEGDAETAILLERLCIEALGGRRIAVFCGYLLDGFEHGSYRPEVEDLCRMHSCLPETNDDRELRTAVDKASQEVLGVPMSVALNRARSDEDTWWRRLPLARRTIVWMKSNVPSAMTRVLERARWHYRASRATQS